MKKIVLIAALMLTGCATPMTMLKNPKTGQVVKCGGSTTGSMVGGVIGYQIQKKNDLDCAYDYQKMGFEVERYTP